MKTFWIFYFTLLIIGCGLYAQEPLDANDLYRAAEYSRDKGGSAVLVMQHGDIVFEQYHNDADETVATHIHSATKAFWASVAALALQQGLLSSYDEKVSDTITEWQDRNKHPGKRNITIRHLLALSSGLSQDIEQIQGDEPAAENIYQYVVDSLRMVSAPGAVFSYGPSHYYAFGVLLQRKLAARGISSNPLQYLQEKILAKLDLTCQNWLHDPAGNPHIPNGCYITPRQWIKYGLFFLQKGMWNGEQIIDGALMEELFTSDGPNPGHGKFLWLNAHDGYGTSQRMKAPEGSDGGFIYHNGSTNLFGALGAGKNRMYMIPSLDAVILRQTLEEEDAFDDHTFLSYIFKDSTFVDPKLIAHWTFDDDSSGTIRDASGNGFHGRGYQLSYGRGCIDKAALFDGAQAEIHIPEQGEKPPAAIASLSQGTISLWFRYQNRGDAILPLFYFGEADSGTPHNSLIIEIGHANNPGNRKLYFTIINQRFCYDSGEDLQENQWYHFAAVVSKTGNTGYLNGKPMSRRHYNLGSDSTFSDFFADVPVQECLAIGYGRYGLDDQFFHFKGAVDDVRIYDAPLSAVEVQSLYAEGTPQGGTPLPTYSNVAYGPYDRNVLDFWQAPSGSPTPLVVYIHGGGFVGGDKTSVSAGNISSCLQRGVSFAAINYRLRNTTRLDTIMLDCARAIQFLRSQSQAWNIDKSRVAAYGGSAGGGASIWLAFHDDLADPGNTDPVLRESARLCAVGHNNSQATYDFEKWADIVGVDANWREQMGFTDDLESLGIEDRSRINDPEIAALRHSLDMLSMMDPQDPPLYLINLRPDTTPQTQNDIIHHPRHAKYLKARCDGLGMKADLITAETLPAEWLDMMDFFFSEFFTSSGVVSESNMPRHFVLQQNWPNPFNPTTRIAFILPSAGHARLTVHNIRGERVAVLNDQWLAAGYHHVTFTGDQLPVGIYFYTLQFANHKYTKRCLLLN
ncbi:serine hydrolase [candidate division KSB1 bacterium]|nr:serine hydrolase [candidate division KSB1 bacterium]